MMIAEIIAIIIEAMQEHRCCDRGDASLHRNVSSLDPVSRFPIGPRHEIPRVEHVVMCIHTEAFECS